MQPVNVSFEHAAPDDVEALVQAQIRAFHYDSVLYSGVEEGGPPGYDSVEDTLKKIREDEFYKILVDGQIVGGIILFEREAGHFHLDVLNIVPEYQNYGIGTQAIKFIEQTYPASKWTLDTPAYAIRNQHFYEKFGYLKVGEKYEEDDFLLYAYEKLV
jgi:GNAT superfamily N-acetyltransferase